LVAVLGEEPQGALGPVDRELGRPAVDAPHRVQPQLHRRDDPEVAAPAAERPEQVGVVAPVGDDDAPARRGELGAQQAAGGDAVLARQPGQPAAERVADDADRRGVPGGRREPERSAAVTTSPPRAPGPTRAMRRSGSTSTWAIREVRSRIPPSGAATVPWPVASTVSGRPLSRAARTVARTSAAVAASTTTSGVPWPPGSYPASPGRCSRPC